MTRRGGGGGVEAASAASAASASPATTVSSSVSSSLCSNTSSAFASETSVLFPLHAPALSSLACNGSRRHMHGVQSSTDDDDDDLGPSTSSSASSASSPSSLRRQPQHPSFRVTLPCRAALTGGSRGRPDLRIRLFELEVGSHVVDGRAATERGSTARRSSWSASRRQPPSSFSSRAEQALDLAARAGALAYFRLASPGGGGSRGAASGDAGAGGVAPAVLKTLAAVGALRAAAPSRFRRGLGRRRGEDEQVTSSPSSSSGTAATAATPPSFQAAVSGATGAALDWIDQFIPPSLLLAAAGAVVTLLYPPTASALRAAAAMAPVAAAYASTSRKTAAGDFDSAGEGMLEEAWRARHREAALRLAPFMTDLAERPPLGWAAALADAATAGAANGGALSSSSSSLGQWGASDGSGNSLWISLPLPGLGGGGGGKSAANDEEKRQRREREHHGEQPRRIPPSLSPTPLAGGKALLLPPMLLQSISGDDVGEGREGDGSKSKKKSKDDRGSINGNGSDGLVLFGGADHCDHDDDGLLYSRTLSPADRVKLATRAVHLAIVFLPFLLLAPVLLVLAAALEKERAGEGEGEGDETTATTTVAVPSSPRPCSPPPPRRTPSDRARALSWSLLLAAVRSSGPAFIKWGQWSATREDMFPRDLCEALSSLHDDAPRHSWRATRDCVEGAFGGRLEDHFESFEREPIASGSIAQVHRAMLKVKRKKADEGEAKATAEEAAGGRAFGRDLEDYDLVPVAVKVRHPSVAERIATDFRLLKPLAAHASRIRGLRGFSLQQSLAQFSATMTAQADLRVEAAHLRRMRRNFAPVSSSVTLPRPIPGYDAAEGCLVESFERGESVAAYMRREAPGASSYNSQIVALGVDAYLKMLLHDNFVHTDLHPGNIMCRVRHGDDDGDDGDGSGGAIGDGNERSKLQLVLLDLGLAEALTPTVRTVFISLLNSISAGDGRAGARLMLRMSSRQRCASPAEFEGDMVSLFRSHADIRSPGGIDLDAVLKGALRAARKHEVSIDSSYAALVVGVCVLVGFARALDPETNLMDAATPSLLAYNLTGKALGRLYS